MRTNQSDYIPLEDIEAIAAYCYKYSEDVDMFIAEKGIDPRFVNHEDYELAYCEAHESEFDSFAYNYNQSRIESEADFVNDCNQDR